MANSRKGVIHCGMLPQDMATLPNDAQDQGLHKQHFLEIFRNPTKGLNEATNMAQYFGIVGCGINPQTRSRQCNL